MALRGSRPRPTLRGAQRGSPCSCTGDDLRNSPEGCVRTGAFEAVLGNYGCACLGGYCDVSFIVLSLHYFCMFCVILFACLCLLYVAFAPTFGNSTHAHSEHVGLTTLHLDAQSLFQLHPASFRSQVVCRPWSPCCMASANGCCAEDGADISGARRSANAFCNRINAIPYFARVEK